MESVIRLVAVKIEIFGRGVIGVGSGYGKEFGLGVWGDIGFVYGKRFGKCIKGGVDVRFFGSLGWNVGRSIGEGVDIQIGGEVGSDDDDGVEL